MASAAASELRGMPEPYSLQRITAGGETIITRGPYVVSRFDTDDIGMRNVSVVALTDAGHAGTEVAACFGITAAYVSMLRGRARHEGSAGLVRRRGRRPKLSAAQVAKARRWSEAGVTNADIAGRLKVHPGTIGRTLDRAGSAAAQDRLDGMGDDRPGPAEEQTPADGEASPADAENERAADDAAGPVVADDSAVPPVAPERAPVVVAEGERSSRYAGAMLLHPFLQALGAAEVFSAAGAIHAGRYDNVAVLAATTFGFALGAGSLEGIKHLSRADAGALVAITAMPELRTLRPRLGAIAQRVDPLALQRAFAKALVATHDDGAQQVFFVDDHFVAYSGARPLAKGWNTKRRHAQRGRDDTFIVDLAGRAICFHCGEPSGLSKTMPVALAELRAICGPQARLLLGFDRGGSYPVTFSKLRAAGVDWVTYRRGQLVAATTAPRWSWFNLDGHRHSYRIADEMVDLDGYGGARQLSVYDAKVVFQVLTSDTAATPARLVHLLRCRWRIENAFKYLTEHHGIDALCDYTMTVAPDTAPVRNPARTEATAALRAAETAMVAAERGLGQAMAGPSAGADYLGTIRRLRDGLSMATDGVTEAKAALKGIPATLAANDVDPTAQRATPRAERRSLQMVLRLLAYNAEGDLARRLNAYLADPDEYRAITRNLLHQGGRISFGADAVTVTIDRPNQPRVARALSLLADELNANPAPMLGDPRPVIYRVGG